MKRYTYIVVAGFAVLTAMLTYLPQAVSAVDVLNNGCNQPENKDKGICKKHDDNVYVVIKNIVSLLVTIGGIIAVIMIVIGGMTYATSGGDSAQTKKAKDTIIYALVGLVIAIMSYAIVNFVLGKVG